MAKIRRYEKVKVKDWGGVFSTDTNYMERIFRDEHISPNVLARWAYGDASQYEEQLKGKLNCTVYCVLYVDEKEGRALITSSRNYGKIYCIRLNCIEPLTPSYTKEELVEIVGYDFELISSVTGKVIC